MWCMVYDDMRTLVKHTIKNKNIQLNLAMGPRHSKRGKKLEIAVGKVILTLNGRQINSLRKMLKYETALS